MNATALSDGGSQNTRDKGEIFWSCVMTIFACTWVAIHPNIPAIADTVTTVALRRAGVMLCGLIAPEIIILWAMRQWYSARKIAQRHREQGWTTTHGFFLQMGGFMLYTADRAIRPLNLEELEDLHSKGDIEWPKITESEILDRSKGDALSKGIVTVQTSWFLIQCIVRGASGLVVTELELLTVAFASLNVVTYFFWWDKPVDVMHSHPVPSRSNVSPQFIESRYHPQRELSGDSQVEWVHLVIKLLSPVLFLMRRLRYVMLAITGKIQRTGRVSTFHAATLSPDPHTFFWMTVACSAIGSIFGGIHCIGWSFTFPSHQEQKLWRFSSVVITFIPIFIALLSHCLKNGYSWPPRGWLFWFLVTTIQVILLVLFVAMYITARFALLVQACVSLRRLSPGALQAMGWTNFVPHF
ncbi:hypothetical protein BDZ94DRAFT_1338539 [Collybia nuda]|uniref:Uncharacterized protein n=1 Tax=Collybia nuda TaxID=64659 RepID=A0A9P5XTW9_9AGAR|nr:hypothetical protein BDZ94DRAFT_1338539 [Collybia nuda]